MVQSSTPIFPEQIAKHYDELDVLYRLVWGEHVHHGWFKNPADTKEEATLRLSHQVAKIAGIQSGQSVCDVGCGYGATSRLLAKGYKANVLGITISPTQFSIAQSMPHLENLKFRKADWLKNDLADQSFDHLIAIESSEHMPNKQRFFDEAYRVLKGSGNIVVCAWLTSNDPSPFSIRHLLEPICREGRMPSMATIEEYKLFLAKAGFQLDSFIDISQSVKRTWTLVIQGLAQYFLKHPKDLRLLLPRLNSNAEFLKSLFRIRLAYEMGAMKYGIFCATKRP